MTRLEDADFALGIPYLSAAAEAESPLAYGLDPK
jgi:hypothetical protein